MKKLLFLIGTLIFSFCNAGQTAELSLAQQINKELASIDNSTMIGILIQDQKTGAILYQKNPDHYFMPASNEKLFTAFAVLQYLGKDYTYQTNLEADVSKINHDILNDNIYLKFSGDPTLTMEQLEHLIQALSKANVHQINGNIVIDDSAFDQQAMSPGTTWDDQYYCWAAPISAIFVENNCARVSIMPGKTTGQPAILIVPDYPQPIHFNNKVVTEHSAVKCAIKVRPSAEKEYLLEGCINENTQPQTIAMAIEKPRANVELLLRYLLNKNHISFNQKIEFKKVEGIHSLLASEKSKTASELVYTFLKSSDNTISNALFKTIGSIYTKDSGSFKNGSEAVRTILHDSLQLDIPKTTLIDGNGSSRYDFMTPRQIVTLLQKISSSQHASRFTVSLPIGGMDGTLEKRMIESSVRGKVYAKTGTATAISTLSGYLMTKQNHTLVFSFMVNGFVDLPDRYEAIEDKLCSILVENA